MSGRLLLGLAAAAAAVLAYGAAPAFSATQGCHSKGGDGTSAVSIYSEQSNVPTSGACSKNGQAVPQYVSLPQAAAKAFKHSHTSKKERALLERLATSTEFGASAPLRLTRAAERVKAPSTLGAAFDLGSGPIALFGALLAMAALVVVGGSLRQRRRD